MLPSTGYFKTIICPFYENGACDRPYCHFKHLRKENVSNTTAAATTVGLHSGGQTADGNKKRGASTSTTTPNSTTIQQLVSDAVIKVLADQGVQDKEKVSENIVSKVVEGLKPTLAPTIGRHIGVPQLISKPPCVYNPTPIAELKRRHIAVPIYMPTRDSKIAVKRKQDDNAKSWLSSLPESATSRSTELTYTPTAIITNSADKDNIPSYVPTIKSENSSNSFDDSNSSDYTTKRKEAYCPRPKKRREEYVPKMIKPPLQSVRQLDELTLDEFDPEFSMLEDIFMVNKKNCNEDNCGISQDYYNIEAKFSDDDLNDDDDVKSTKQLDKSKVNDQTVHIEENENSIKDFEIIENKHSHNKTKDKVSTHDTHRASETNNKSSKENSNKENSKRESERSKKHSSSSSSKSHNKEKKERDKKDDKHCASTSDKHRSSSSSKSSDKSSHKKSSKSSSSHRHKDKPRSNKSSNENDKSHHKSSRHDKDESSRSKSSRNTALAHRSSKSRKSSREQLIDGKISSDHKGITNGLFEHSSMDVEELLATSDSDHDVEEECLKIFQEYQVTDHPKSVTVKHELIKPETEEIEGVGKKRVAHLCAATSVVRNLGPSQPPKRIQNPQQRMYERWRLMREAAAEKAAEKAAVIKIQADKEPFVPQRLVTAETKSHENIVKSINNEPQVNGNGRVRIAPIPHAMALIAKKKGNESAAKPQEPKTIAQTTKGGPRVAHIPQAIPQLVRPEPLHVATQKFPLNVRQYYVNLMHDICIQIYTIGDDAAQRALREELACHERCKALPVYKNSCMLAAHRLRKEVDQSSAGDDPAPSGSGMVSHDAVLAGKTKGSWSVVKTKKVAGNFKGPALYCMLKKWIMTPQQLKDNGFPRPHPEGPKGRAKLYVVNTRNHSIISKVPNERYCSRCGQSYMIDKYGLAVQSQNCIYHWGRKFTIRGEGKYSCCQQYGAASGCCDAKNHVWDHIDPENLRGYVKTLPKDIPAEDQGVFALDCEMCYTTQGLELTRITVIDEGCKVIYETLVKPDNPIIDYNTRFSGITEDNMLGVTTSLLDVQATLLTMFSNETILVGHSLESDFKALKLIHDTVVDTSTVFPHKNGYPQKRALRNLCSEYLRKIIQNDVGGHDSNEDAVACMELIHWKVKEEAKLQ